MVNFLDKVAESTVGISIGLINTCVSVKGGVMPIGEGFARALHDVYSINGFERWSKALIADLRFLSLIPSLKGVFNECLKTLEAQKDLYYSTQFIGFTADFIKKDANNKWVFYLPQKDGGTDIVKILYLIGSYCEAGKFLQKNRVFTFSTLTAFANHYGAYRIFNTRLDDVPVFCTLFDKPKDFFIFSASAIDTWKCTQRRTLDPENLFKFTTSTGKMILIACGKNYSRTWWFAIIDVITQNAGLLAFIYKQRIDREKRFKGSLSY